MNEALKKLRLENGETQIQMASLLGLKTASAYCKKEKGQVPLTFNEIKILANHYNKPLNFFAE